VNKYVGQVAIGLRQTSHHVPVAVVTWKAGPNAGQELRGPDDVERAEGPVRDRRPDDATIGHCTFQPGWRWSADVGLMASRRPIRHLGYSMSGRPPSWTTRR
jgi:hypothetical protein